MKPKGDTQSCPLACAGIHAQIHADVYSVCLCVCDVPATPSVFLWLQLGTELHDIQEFTDGGLLRI